MNQFNLYSYKPGSRSGKELAGALGIKRIKHRGSRYKGAPHKTLINWGANELPAALHGSRVINSPAKVKQATDKLTCFQALEAEGVSIPRFTTMIDLARSWIENDNAVVFCRTLLRANGGRGIVQADTVDELVPAPLYVEYKKKKSEWRVHVIGDVVVQTDRKVKRADVEIEDIKDWRVRNHDAGFIFQRENDNIPEDVQVQAALAVRALDLDFGAVDVIWNEHEQKAYVLEVNTAPGLAGQTLDNYRKEFQKLL